MINVVQKTLRIAAASALLVGGLLGAAGATQASAAVASPQVVGVQQYEFFNTPGDCIGRFYQLNKYYAHVQPCMYSSSIGVWYISYNLT